MHLFSPTPRAMGVLCIPLSTFIVLASHFLRPSFLSMLISLPRALLYLLLPGLQHPILPALYQLILSPPSVLIPPFTILSPAPPLLVFNPISLHLAISSPSPPSSTHLPPSSQLIFCFLLTLHTSFPYRASLPSAPFTFFLFIFLSL